MFSQQLDYYNEVTNNHFDELILKYRLTKTMVTAFNLHRKEFIVQIHKEWKVNFFTDDFLLHPVVKVTGRPLATNIPFSGHDNKLIRQPKRRENIYKNKKNQIRIGKNTTEKEPPPHQKKEREIAKVEVS